MADAHWVRWVEKEPWGSVQGKKTESSLVVASKEDKTPMKTCKSRKFSGRRSPPTYKTPLMKTDHISLLSNQRADPDNTGQRVKAKYSANTESIGWEARNPHPVRRTFSVNDPILGKQKGFSVGKSGEETSSEDSARTNKDLVDCRLTFNRRKGVANFYEASSVTGVRFNPQHSAALNEHPRTFHKKAGVFGQYVQLAKESGRPLPFYTR